MNHLLKHFTSVLLGAVALMTTLAGCQREPVSNNPNYDSETNKVRTQFVLSVNTKADEGTKMTANNVQLNNNFLGMQDVHILTYELGASNTPSTTATWTPPTVNTRVGKFFFNPVGTTATEDYNFGNLFEENGITSSKQSRTLELAFPLGTNAVVLYGKALNTLGPESQGAASASGSPSNLASLKFGLTRRIDPNSTTGTKPFIAGAAVFQGILTSILLSALINEDEYWTTDGKAVVKENDQITSGNNYLPVSVTGTSALLKDKHYRVWVNSANDKLETGGSPSTTLTVPGGTRYYDNNETYTPVNSSITYKMKSGNCSWKMLGDLYKAKHDGNDNTTLTNILTTHGANDLVFAPLLELLGQAYYNLMNINTITVDTDIPLNQEAYSQDPGNYTGGFKTITYHELRAGSAAAILRTMRDLDFIVHKVINSTPTSWSEVVAQQLANEIDSRISLYFSGHQDAMLYNAASVITSQLTGHGVNLSVLDINATTPQYTDYNHYFSDDYLMGTGTGNVLDGSAGFPMNTGLPMGSAYLETETGGSDKPFLPDRFLFKEDIPAYAFGLNTYFNIYNYCYPPELMYYGNSPVHVSSTDHTASDYPQTIVDWRKTTGQDVAWGETWELFSAVNSNTKSVAMAMPINYGTALLKATVKYPDGLHYLLDNNKGIHPDKPSEQNKQIKVVAENNEDAVNTGIIVTGIVIGGQPKAVTWDYTRMPDHVEDGEGNVTTPPNYASVGFDGDKFTNLTYENDQFGMMIYDKSNQFRIGDPGLAEGGNVIYTLCWDNYDALASAADQADVYIALELRNETGEDFWGETNLIRKGGTFYLVGKLDIKNKVDTDNYNAIKNNMVRSDYYYPPFNPSTGETIKVPRVFMQDYVTNAVLTLQENALQHAYMTVPDLRSNQVSLGVSVDITWKEGLSFDVNMGVLE